MAAGTRVLLRPVLARIFFHDIDLEEVTEVVRKVENVKPGMRHYVIRQHYGGRNLYAPVFKIDPKFGGIPDGEVGIVGVFEEPRKWHRMPREGKEGEEARVKTRTIIKIYKPGEVKHEPRYVAVFAAFDGRETKRGGYADAEVVDVEDVKWSYSFTNTSRSGRHWTRYILMIARRVVVKYRSRSNSGNYSVRVYEFTPEGLKTEEKSCTVRKARKRLEAAALVASINPSLASKIIDILREEEERCKEQVDC